jgi:hypothetical protein
MRTYRLALTVALALLASPASVHATTRASFATPELALEHGLRAYTSGRTAQAIDALEVAATANGRAGFLAQFYLARVYADNNRPTTDHAKAYVLYQRIADTYADIDPDDDQRAPFVAKSLVALAGYMRHGVSEIGLKPDLRRAAQYLHYAATFFADEDAQFELAKLFITGDGLEPDERRAVHWLSVLSQRGHPGAQALLADLHWRGRFVSHDPSRALALATLAAEGAPANERIWIEDIYQRIFCGASEGQRTAAGDVVADWRQKYGRAQEPVSGLSLWATPVRACRDGRLVRVPGGTANGISDVSDVQAAVTIPPAAVSAPAAVPAGTTIPTINASTTPLIGLVGRPSP